jgi:hypothetical protein
MGAGLVNARLPKPARVVKERLTKKPSRREPGRRRPVRSFRFENWFNQGINPERARSRWLTERIASRAAAREDPIHTMRTQVRVSRQRSFEELRQNVLKKSGRITFFLVDQGPNGWPRNPAWQSRVRGG